MVTFTDRVEKFIPPRKGSKHALYVIREALHNRPKGSGTDIAAALEYVNMVAKRRMIMFLVSDFISPEFRKLLGVTNKRHDVIAVNVMDPAEKEFPSAGVVKMHDAETGEAFVVDTSSRKVRERYKANMEKALEEKERVFGSLNVDSITVRTNESYVDPLIRFFKMRERRISRG
jgi:uncharacterized protein (DUF58 family)